MLRRVFSSLILISLIIHFSVSAFAQANTADTCKQSLDESLRLMVYGAAPEMSTEIEFSRPVSVNDLGYLKKQQALFSSDVSTSALVDSAIFELRDLVDEMDKNCTVLRTIPANSNIRTIPFSIANERGMAGCADLDLSLVDSLNLDTYCDERVSFYTTLLIDQMKSMVMQSGIQQNTSRLVREYKKLNKKLYSLSDDVVRMAQLIVTFNSYIGDTLTRSCLE